MMLKAKRKNVKEKKCSFFYRTNLLALIKLSSWTNKDLIKVTGLVFTYRESGNVVVSQNSSKGDHSSVWVNVEVLLWDFISNNRISQAILQKKIEKNLTSRS